MRITIGYLHDGTVRAEFMDSVMGTVRRKRGVEWHMVSMRSGADITRKRNALFRHVAESPPVPDYLWWLDSDMVVPFDAADYLTADRYDENTIVAGLSCIVNEDMTKRPAFRVWSRDRQALFPGTWHDVRKAQEDGAAIEVAAVGMACTLIPRNVLEKMAGPTEDLWPYAELTWPEVMGRGTTEDDVTFCLRADGLGFKVMVDPDVVVGHVKDAVVWP